MLNKLVYGKKYYFKKEYKKDDLPLLGGFIPVGEVVVYNGKSIGYAHFYLERYIPTWRKGQDKLVILPAKLAFRILEEVKDG
ncbi:MAG: hypothetical protein ACTSPL_04255 [Candidatus Odinarchaeia archaeon]